MLGGLFVNTLLSQGQFEIQELQNKSIALADEHEVLAQNVDRMESPEILKQKAIENIGWLQIFFFPDARCQPGG